MSLLADRPDLRPLPIPSVFNGFFGTVRWALGRADIVAPATFHLQQSTCSQNVLASFPNTQKNRKMKKPCRELNTAKRNWKAVEASRTVRAPNTHVNPKRDITPMMLIMSLKAIFRFAQSLVAYFLQICFASTLITITNMIALKSRMAKMGPSKAPKNTPVLPMKQLEEGSKLCMHC